MGADVGLGFDLYGHVAFLLLYFYRLETMGDGQRDIGQFVGFDEGRGDIDIGDIFGGQRKGDAGRAFADVDILIRKYLVGLHGDEHPAVKGCFEQRADVLAGIVARLVERDIDMSFVVDLEAAVIARPRRPSCRSFWLT